MVARVVDVHAHWIPDSALVAAKSGSDWHGTQMSLTADGYPRLVTAGQPSVVGSMRHYDGVEGRLEDMDRMGVDIQVLSVLPSFFRYGLPAEAGLKGCVQVNDDLRGFIDSAPDRFAGWGTLPLQAEPEVVIGELNRCRTELGFVGVAIGTHVRGEHLGSGRFDYLWEALSGAGAPVFLHPPAGDRRALDLPGGFFLDNALGNPIETTLALSSLILSGAFERYPGLRVIAAHGGGFLPAAVGRIGHAVRVRAETGRLLHDRDGWLPRGVFVDTLTHSPAALRFIVDELGADHVMLGTDYPSDMGDDHPVAFVQQNLAGVDATPVLAGNALRELALSPAGLRGSTAALDNTYEVHQ